MTWPPRIPWWVSPLAVGVAVLAVVWALNGRRNATRELEREREERALEVAGLNVAHQVERDAILQDLMGEAAASAALTEELARVQAAAPGAKPIATAHGSTPWKPVGPAAGSAPVSPPASGVEPPSVPALCLACPACRLVEGDEMQVRAGGAVLETDLGNYVVAAAASVWRRPGGGGPEEELHQEALRLEVKVKEQAAEKGWGAGVLALAGREGWAVGPAASPPVLHILGLDLELVAGIAAGPDGYWSSAATGVVRW